MRALYLVRAREFYPKIAVTMSAEKPTKHNAAPPIIGMGELRLVLFAATKSSPIIKVAIAMIVTRSVALSLPKVSRRSSMPALPLAGDKIIYCACGATANQITALVRHSRACFAPDRDSREWSARGGVKLADGVHVRRKRRGAQNIRDALPSLPRTAQKASADDATARLSAGSDHALLPLRQGDGPRHASIVWVVRACGREQHKGDDC